MFEEEPATDQDDTTLPLFPPTILEVVNLTRSTLLDPIPNDEIKECGSILRALKRCPKSLLQLAYEQMHVVPYKDVRTCWRRLYTDAALWIALGVLESVELGEDVSGEEKDEEGDWVTRVVKSLDMALILTGGPRREELIELIFSALEGVIEKEEGGKEVQEKEQDGSDYTLTQRPAKRQKLELPAPRHDGGQEDVLPTPAEDATYRREDNKEDPIPAMNSQKKNPKPVKLATKPWKLKPPSSKPTLPSAFPTILPPEQQPALRHPIPRIPSSVLTLQKFESKLSTPTTQTPTIITSAIDFWPALNSPTRSWSHPSYLLSRTLNGRRLVPIELGRTYTDSDWGQKILSFGDFIYSYMFSSLPTSPNHSTRNEENTQPKQTAYLAQHDLFTHLPSLRADISIPDYCYVSLPTPPWVPENISSLSTPVPPKLETPLLNAWFGPAGTISPLHTDPYHNILAQVVGYKYVRLYAPGQTRYMYPRGKDERGVDMGNTSSVDLDEVGSVFGEVGIWGVDGWSGEQGRVRAVEEKRRKLHERFPGFVEAEYVECVLGPGDCLYIPVGWWHYVRSLTPSFSVSFWFN
ncbi:Clavaminate synthase-like protein [Sporormia fimetaria CBS 119925]|uniref:Clavaminate synthase-like protein n=1 Tax=Sporormia fimetaria CBS 119925 TaxID=1340428 RepID=A0A6A6VGC5_9PLEO|nr:Clavaminate synthase-like protein [Sporormia fimetaria CBS 119925]